jgi:hypothetical protein
LAKKLVVPLRIVSQREQNNGCAHVEKPSNGCVACFKLRATASCSGVATEKQIHWHSCECCITHGAQPTEPVGSAAV